ncbi:hypothetical protein [Cellulomonas soli]
MIELPEAAAFAAGLQVALAGRTVLDAQAGVRPTGSRSTRANRVRTVPACEGGCSAVRPRPAAWC